MSLSIVYYEARWNPEITLFRGTRGTLFQGTRGVPDQSPIMIIYSTVDPAKGHASSHLYHYLLAIIIILW